MQPLQGDFGSARSDRPTLGESQRMRLAEPRSKVKGYLESSRDIAALASVTRADANEHPWRQALVSLGVSLAWIFAWYASTAASMADIWWRSATFTHGFVVPPITLWLIWRQRHELAKMTPRPTPVWLAGLVATGFAWLVGEIAVINAVTHAAFVTMLVAVVPIILGTTIARRIAFPLGFLYFAVPFGEFMLPQLMQWTADFTVAALQLSGVPVYREGLQFVIPSGHWSIVEACSGIRYLIASVMVGTLYAHLSYRTWTRRLAFVGVAILVPIVANWLRAYMIVMIGHLSNNRLAVGVDHLLYGWIFFGIVMVLMFAVGSRWRESPSATMPRDIPRIEAGARPSDLRYWIAGVLIMGITAFFAAADWRMERGIGTDGLKLDESIEARGWTASSGGFTSWKPRYVGPSAESHTTFRKDDRTVGLYIAYYRNQGRDRKLVSSQNVFVTTNDKDWTSVVEGTRVLHIARSGPLKAHVEELRGPGDRRLIAVKAYWVSGMWTTSDYVAKLYPLFAQMQGRGDDGAAVIVYAEMEQAAGRDSIIDSFLDDAGPAIVNALERARERR
jgi:exosortase A